MVVNDKLTAQQTADQTQLTLLYQHIVRKPYNMLDSGYFSMAGAQAERVGGMAHSSGFKDTHGASDNR